MHFHHPAMKVPVGQEFDPVSVQQKEVQPSQQAFPLRQSEQVTTAIAERDRVK